MPELPEVETIMLGVSPFLEGATIKKIKLSRPELRWPFPENFANRLKEANVLGLKRRSKYILIALSTGETLLIHLGMSGKILVSGSKIGSYFHESAKGSNHDHVIFELYDGTIITYNDPRRFGFFEMQHTVTVDGQINLPGIDGGAIAQQITDSIGGLVADEVKKALDNPEARP